MLEWREANQCRSRSTPLLNISRGGVLACCDASAHGRVALRLDSPAVTGWVAARVVRRDGEGRIAMEFDEPCPDELYLGATLGIGFETLFR
jgi:hypothetical protein